MSEEIIAYRVDDHFLCPKHYQMSAKILAVHEIKLPAQPVKEGEIESLICRQCKDAADEREAAILLSPKETIEPARKTLSKREKVNLTRVQDIINDCGCKLSFASDFFCQGSRDDQIEFSRSAVSGLVTFLDEIRDDLNFVVNEMSEMKRKDLIIEKAE